MAARSQTHGEEQGAAPAAPAAPRSPGQEVVLGVVTPALSDLTVAARAESIRKSDSRTDAEVAGRWAHLSPIVEAFYTRLGATLEVAQDPEPAVDPHAETVGSPAVIDEDEALPPDPGELALEADGAASRPGTQQELFSDAPEAAPAPPEDEAAALAPAEDESSRVDAESHERLQTEGAGDGLDEAARLLYEDVLWLFEINDGEGALISLERLLTIGQVDPDVAQFLDLNGAKLLALYEDYIGPFDKVPVRGETTPDAMPAGYLSQGALKQVFEMIDGERSIADLIDASERTPLETCASVEQLHRARLVQL